MTEPHHNGMAGAGGYIPVLVDSEASERYLDDYTTPGLWGRLSNYNSVGTAQDHHRRQPRVQRKRHRSHRRHRHRRPWERQSEGLAIVIVGRLGKYIFSVLETTLEGITTVFALNYSRIATSGFNLPPQRVAGIRDPFFFNMEADALNVALRAKADADA